nr:hypothetical protein [Tanacetum cinerariifolium]
MVKERIVLGHKVSGSEIVVDKAKIKAISKLPYPTNVKGIRSFLRHAGFYRRFIKDFSQIARPMTQLLVKDAPFNFSEECIQAFDKLKRELTQDAKLQLIRWILLLQEFNIKIHDKKGAKNIAASHLSQLENPDLGKLTKAEIRENKKFFSDLRHYFWDEQFLFKQCADRIIQRCIAEDEATQILWQCHSRPSGGHHGIATTVNKVFKAGFYWPHIFHDARNRFYGTFPPSNGNNYILINELDEMRLDAYESSISYKERTKRWHDKRIKAPTNYERGDKVKPYQESVLDTNRDGDITLDDEGKVTKFLIKNEEEIFTDTGDGVRIYPDGVVSLAM